MARRFDCQSVNASVPYFSGPYFELKASTTFQQIEGAGVACPER
jgi:hypothetical protein